jgi:hypothetical protein
MLPRVSGIRSGLYFPRHSNGRSRRGNAVLVWPGNPLRIEPQAMGVMDNCDRIARLRSGKTSTREKGHSDAGDRTVRDPPLWMRETRAPDVRMRCYRRLGSEFPVTVDVSPIAETFGTGGCPPGAWFLGESPAGLALRNDELRRYLKIHAINVTQPAKRVAVMPLEQRPGHRGHLTARSRKPPC